MENLRPGSMSKMGLGQSQMRALNPRLVWAIISGFGQMEGYTPADVDRLAAEGVVQTEIRY